VERQRFSASSRFTTLAGVTLAGMLGMANPAAAQAITDLKTPDTPLVLKAQGSFFVGGEKAEQTQVELGGLGPGGHITVNQMYVRYMVPQGGDGNVPVVMVHGATLTGKSWETTPDGRMGWDEYFVRKGHPVYVPDQVGRGRSGFNQAVLNNVRAGSAPASNLPPWLRFSDEVVWPNFRFGSAPGVPYADSQFPVTAVDELSKQGVPDMSFGLPRPNPTLKPLSDLATQLKGVVLMGHSQSGPFPLEAALLNPAAAKGLVLVEPGRCPDTYTDQQITTLAKIPILAVFGDHRDTPTGISTRPSWQLSFESCQALIGRLKAAGGDAEMLKPPERGIRGNSHMIMQDKNHLQIADLILQWIDAHVGNRSAGNKQQPPASNRPQGTSRRPSGEVQQRIAPGLATLTDEVLFGDVWQRPELSPRDRSLVTISVLIATGKSAVLAGHLGRALDNGVQPGEASGLLAHLAVYCGWPSAVAALDVYDRVYTARKVDTAALRAASPRLPAPAADAARAKAVTEEFGAVAPKFVQLTNEVVFDDLWRRSDLSLRDRSLVTIAALAATGDDDQIDLYVRRGLESGLTRGQIAEAVTHLGFYAGWPRATKAMTAITRSLGK
jgi:alkylhydroperoxidase/carboxymuconolactone decarboxylase family protein YurZ/pimeloyl-ACP methyl ester carboxylesterase